MNILHVISGDLWAGAEVQVFSLIRELSRIPTINQNVIIFNDGILRNKLLQEGISVTLVEEAKFTILGMIVRCWKIMNGLSQNIVHVHGFKENFIGGFVARIVNANAIVRTHHGKGIIGLARRYDFIEHINDFLLTDFIIAVSFDLKEILEKNGISSHKISVVHNGIMPDAQVNSAPIQVLKQKIGIEDDEFVIGAIGRLVAVKDYKTFIAGAKIILEVHQKTKFIVVGDGPLQNDLEAQAIKLNIIDKIKFLGFQEDVMGIIQTFDIFAMTSLHEGIPMALLEAMSMKKPIVATNVGGIPEIICDSQNGLLIPAEDPEALANACLRLQRNATLRNCLSHCGFEYIQRKYSLKIMAEQTLAVYKEVLRQ